MQNAVFSGLPAVVITFAPTIDRIGAGQGFTHSVGDLVEVSTPQLGTLVNRVNHTDRIAPWTFGAGGLMRSLARRGVLKV